MGKSLLFFTSNANILTAAVQIWSCWKQQRRIVVYCFKSWHSEGSLQTEPFSIFHHPKVALEVINNPVSFCWFLCLILFIKQTYRCVGFARTDLFPCLYIMHFAQGTQCLRIELSTSTLLTYKNKYIGHIYRDLSPLSLPLA